MARLHAEIEHSRLARSSLDQPPMEGCRSIASGPRHQQSDRAILGHLLASCTHNFVVAIFGCRDTRSRQIAHGLNVESQSKIDELVSQRGLSEWMHSLQLETSRILIQLLPS